MVLFQRPFPIPHITHVIQAVELVKGRESGPEGGQGGAGLGGAPWYLTLDMAKPEFMNLTIGTSPVVSSSVNCPDQKSGSTFGLPLSICLLEGTHRLFSTHFLLPEVLQYPPPPAAAAATSEQYP